MKPASSAHFDQAIADASEAPPAQGSATQDHRSLRPRHSSHRRLLRASDRRPFRGSADRLLQRADRDPLRERGQARSLWSQVLRHPCSTPALGGPRSDQAAPRPAPDGAHARRPGQQGSAGPAARCDADGLAPRLAGASPPRAAVPQPPWRAAGGVPRPYAVGSVRRADHAAPRGDRVRAQKKIPPHSLRHRSATPRIEAGVDLLEVQKILGHASILSAAQYTHLSAHTTDSASERMNAWMSRCSIDWGAVKGFRSPPSSPASRRRFSARTRRPFCPATARHWTP